MTRRSDQIKGEITSPEHDLLASWLYRWLKTLQPAEKATDLSFEIKLEHPCIRDHRIVAYFDAAVIRHRWDDHQVKLIFEIKPQSPVGLGEILRQMAFYKHLEPHAQCFLVAPDDESDDILTEHKIGIIHPPSQLDPLIPPLSNSDALPCALVWDPEKESRPLRGHFKDCPYGKERILMGRDDTDAPCNCDGPPIF